MVGTVGFSCHIFGFQSVVHCAGTCVCSVYRSDLVLFFFQIMETPLDVLSRAASLVQPDTRESKSRCVWMLFLLRSLCICSKRETFDHS